MTDHELTKLIGTINAGWLFDRHDREHALSRLLPELRARGHFDWNGVRYSAGADGTIKRGLPW
jgi:hypothetical protein